MKKCSILVVEDEALIAANLVHTLSSLGYTVHKPVATGEDAIRAVKAQKPDLVLMDIQLIGEMDGIEAAEKIRAIADIPIVYLTAYTDDLRLKQARLTEPYGYIVKPAHSRELHATIEMALYKHKLDRKLKESEKKYRLLADHAQDMITRHAADGTYLYVSPASQTLFGYMPDELMGQKSLEFVHSEDRERFSSQYFGQLAQGGVTRIEYRRRTKNGDYVWVENVAHTIRDRANGEIQELICVIRDITERKRAEEILRESEARFRKILEMAPLPLCYVNMNGVITFRNERFVQIFGYTADDVPTLAEWWQQAYPDAHYRQWVTTTWDAAVKRATEDGIDIKPVEYTVTCKSGEERIIEISGITLGDDFLAIFIDLTERRLAESAFRQLSADHKVIIDNAPAMVWYKDTKNNFIRVNPAGALAFGLPVEEIEGKSTYDLFPDFAEKYYQDDLDVINSGKPRLGIIEPMTTASGEHRWVQTDKIPLRDEQGTITGILVFSVDITERKRAEVELLESRQRFQGLVETLYDWIWEVDYHGRYTYVSPRIKDVLGYEPEELLGKTPFDIMPTEEMHRISELFGQLIVEQTPILALENICLHKDGHPVIMETNGLPFYDIKGNYKGYRGTDRDITERKELEKEMEYHTQELQKFSTSLATANKKLNLLSSITRHDINNQLTVLMGYLAIINRKQPYPTLNEYFQKVGTAAQRISTLIQFTREYENIGVNAPVWQDCRTLVDTAVKQVPLGKIKVKNDFPAGTEVFADPLIFKVCYNLMDNAVRYGGKITTIRFSVQESGEDRIIVCEDDGDGVVAEEKEKIFEKGFGKNTGLGLALSREILSITGITIHETGEPGKGARFEMAVPKGAWK